MKNIAFIMTTLPVPAVKGGAVETLVEYLINKNEEYKKFQIEVYSIFDVDAYKASQNYKNTAFTFIKNTNLTDSITSVFIKMANRIFKTKIPEDLMYLIKIRQKSKGKHYDCVIVENRPQYIPVLYDHIGNTNQYYLHLHNEHFSCQYKNYKKFENYNLKYIAVSNYIKNIILETGISDEKIFVLKNAVNIENFANVDKRREEIRLKFDIKPSEKVILYCGRISPEKGVKELIKAFVKIKEKSNYKLMIVGASWFSSTIKNKYQKNIEILASEIPDRICFTGYMEHNHIWEAYAAADVCCIPSVWNEPGALVLLEALAAGKSIIASATGGTTEVINSDCAIIVKVDEKYVDSLASGIEYICENDVIRREMGKQSKLLSKNYSLKTYYENFCKILEF
ncbi:glycosyltransferase family 4 protein [Hungatella hathewayi]